MSQSESGTDQPTVADIQSAYTVLEYLRDEWGNADHITELANEVHYLVQELEETDSIKAPPKGTEIQIHGVPQEAIDFAFDQLEGTHLRETLKRYRDFPMNGEISLDYGNGTVSMSEDTVIEQILLDSIDEKLAQMLTEVEAGARDDHSVEELLEARQNIQLSIQRGAFWES